MPFTFQHSSFMFLNSSHTCHRCVVIVAIESGAENMKVGRILLRTARARPRLYAVPIVGDAPLPGSPEPPKAILPYQGAAYQSVVQFTLSWQFRAHTARTAGCPASPGRPAGGQQHRCLEAPVLKLEPWLAWWEESFKHRSLLLSPRVRPCDGALLAQRDEAAVGGSRACVP